MKFCLYEALPLTMWGTKGFAFWKISPPLPSLKMIAAGYPPTTQVLNWTTLPYISGSFQYP